MHTLSSKQQKPYRENFPADHGLNPSTRLMTPPLLRYALESRPRKCDMSKTNSVSDFGEMRNNKWNCTMNYREEEYNEGKLEGYQLSNQMQTDNQSSLNSCSHQPRSSVMNLLNTQQMRKRGNKLPSRSPTLRRKAAVIHPMETLGNQIESSTCTSIPAVRIVTILLIILCNFFNSYAISIRVGSYFFLFLSLVAIVPLGLIKLIVRRVVKETETQDLEKTKASLNSQLWCNNQSPYLLVVPYYNQQLQKSQYCSQCKKHQLSNRLIHCRRCNVCHAGYDHYCVWLNCCIFDQNYANFLRFVIVVSFNVFCIFVDSLVFLTTLQQSGHLEWKRMSVIFVVCGASALVTLIFCCYVLAYHLFLQNNGVSTKQYLARGMLMPGINTFCKSICWRPQLQPNPSQTLPQGVFFLSLSQIRGSYNQSNTPVIKNGSLKLISNIKCSEESESNMTEAEQQSITIQNNFQEPNQHQSYSGHCINEQNIEEISDMTNSVIDLSDLQVTKVVTNECNPPAHESN